MITILKTNHIEAIAEAHCLAWQVGFKGILSDKLLDSLCQENFAKNWNTIIKRENRTNYIFLQKNKAVGFISYGSPYEELEKAQFEIYGIYVHPDFWKKKIGFQLLEHVIYKISDKEEGIEIILWVMLENKNSRSFYEKFGFKPTISTRISERNKEKFEEIKYSFTC